MNRRVELLKYTFLNRSFGGSFFSWALNMFSPPCTFLGKQKSNLSLTPDGFKKIIIKGIPDPLYVAGSISSRSIYQTLTEQLYSWQWHYYNIPQTQVTKEDIVFDLGCAEGLFTFLFKDTARHIYAFEPLPEFQQGLAKTFHSTNNITLVSTALGKEKGSAYLKEHGIASFVTKEPTPIPIQLDTLDSFCQLHKIYPTYLKADLEGFECDVLEGASEIIAAHHPKIAITTYHKASHANEIKSFLKKLCPNYHFKTKGIEERKGAPVMLHAWHK